MTKRAQLSDGTVLEFPDETTDQVMDQVVRSHMARARQEQEARTRSGDPMQPGSVIGSMAGRSRLPSRQQVEQVAQSAARRQSQRQSVPFGLGFVTQPLTNLIEQPERRAALGRSAANAWRDVQQIPSLDFGRLGRETAQSAQEGVRNLPSTLARIPGQIPQIARAATYGPFQDEENAQRRLDLANVTGNQSMAEQAAGEANASTAGAALNVGAPLFGGGSVLRAAGVGAGLSAPFALARNSDQPLQERLPGALTEIGGVSLLSGAAQGLANGLPQVRPSRGNQRAADFETAGVRPTMAAVNQGASAGATKLISENFFAGGPVRARLQASIDDTANAAGRLANEAGEIAPREIVGENVQSAIRRFTRDAEAPNPRPGTSAIDVPDVEWTIPAKSRALYDDIFERLGADENAYVAGGVNDLLSLDDTNAVVNSIRNRVSGTESRQAMASPRIEEIASALANDAADGSLRFRDLREWRTWARDAQIDEGLRQGVRNADLQRLERALTRDIYTSAQRIGGQAADDLRAADRWYRHNATLVKEVLGQFNQGGGAQAYRRMIDLASHGGRQNVRAIARTLEVLPRDVRRSLNATLIDELGNPSFGAPNVMEPGAFSVNTFATNYARLQRSGGNRALFGDELANRLDTLARVAGYQKGVEAMANNSRSGITAQNVGTGLALVNPSTMAPTMALLAAGVITGEMLTNPAFVRWLTSAPRNGGAAGMRRHLGELRRLAARDPALGPAVAEIESRLQDEQSRPAPASNGGPANTPPQRAPALR